MREFICRNFHGASIICRNLGIPAYEYAGFYAKGGLAKNVVCGECCKHWAAYSLEASDGYVRTDFDALVSAADLKVAGPNPSSPLFPADQIGRSELEQRCVPVQVRCTCRRSGAASAAGACARSERR